MNLFSAKRLFWVRLTSSGAILLAGLVGLNADSFGGAVGGLAEVGAFAVEAAEAAESNFDVSLGDESQTGTGIETDAEGDDEPEDFVPPAIDVRRDPSDADVVFQLGVPDAQSAEFNSNFGDWRKIRETKGQIVYSHKIGESPDISWPAMQYSSREYNNVGVSYTYTLELQFDSPRDYADAPLYFIVGETFTHWTEPSLICVETNGVASEKVRTPVVKIDKPNGRMLDPDNDVGAFEHSIVEIPAGAVKKGANVLRLTLDDGSWIFYDYFALREKPEPLKRLPLSTPVDMFESFAKRGMKGVKEIVFAERQPGTDPHWYANFGYYATTDETYRPFPAHNGGALRVLNVETKEVRTLLEDAGGAVRDPVVHYDGEKILFSYLKSGTEHFNLYEINVDGTGLRQITSGDYDDIESCYLPDGGIAFCSTRCDRFVQCWLTSVATVYRCGPNGEDIRPLSANVEQDNEPWVLPNGQIVYTRWEYVDREQMTFHHLWTMNPDGTRQQVFFGNQHTLGSQSPQMLIIGAKPIPGSEKVVATISPGHGIREHYGRIATIDPKLGPDNIDAMKFVSKKNSLSDPWAFSETEFIAARDSALVLLNARGREQVLYELPKERRDAGFWIEEPRPIIKRDREPIPADGTNLAETTGTLILSDVYAGRKMKDVPRGTVKELLVMETLPEPIHYSGGMDMISSGGTFTLERVLGTVPVTPEGAAAIKLPALRSVFFIALDADGNSVKRMHSFTSVMPGETTSCVGCHETRTEAPGTDFNKRVFDVADRAIAPTPVEGIPDVFDFPRDIQPLLDKYCVECHNADRLDGGVDLTGDATPLYSRSYLALSRRNMFGDNRNSQTSDYEPYKIGAQASRFFQMINAKHGGVEFSDAEKKIVRFYLEAGAPFAGTYAANATGLIGWYYQNKTVHNDVDWPETKALIATMERRCDGCHPSADEKKRLPRFASDDASWKRFDLFNLTRPEKSRLLRAPLSKDAGGFGICVETKPDGSQAPVFQNAEDADYRTMLAGIERGRRYITTESQRFTTEPFVPNPAYVRFMKRYGVLPPDFDPATPIDTYALERKYWDKFNLERTKSNASERSSNK